MNFCAFTPIFSNSLLLSILFKIVFAKSFELLFINKPVTLFFINSVLPPILASIALSKYKLTGKTGIW